jgi:hypothetical protein
LEEGNQDGGDINYMEDASFMMEEAAFMLEEAE